MFPPHLKGSAVQISFKKKENEKGKTPLTFNYFDKLKKYNRYFAPHFVTERSRRTPLADPLSRGRGAWQQGDRF